MFRVVSWCQLYSPFSLVEDTKNFDHENVTIYYHRNDFLFKFSDCRPIPKPWPTTQGPPSNWWSCLNSLLRKTSSLNNIPFYKGCPAIQTPNPVEEDTGSCSVSIRKKILPSLHQYWRDKSENSSSRLMLRLIRRLATDFQRQTVRLADRGNGWGVIGI